MAQIQIEERYDRSLRPLLSGPNELQADLGGWIRNSGPEGLEHSLWSGAQSGCRALSYFCRLNIIKEKCGVVIIFFSVYHMWSRFSTVFNLAMINFLSVMFAVCIQMEEAR